MRTRLPTLILSFVAACSTTPVAEPPPDPDPAFAIEGMGVHYAAELDALVFEMSVEGRAGSVKPVPAGQVHGAPVLGYVFPTTLASTDVGFDAVEGTVALALTSHPDFDDTPLWDEDGNAAYDDDGAVYHAHWVVLEPNEAAPAGLAVKVAGEEARLPPTAPMPMYLDSPGFTVVEQEHAIRVVVPLDRVRRKLGFQFGALTAAMRVDASGPSPVLKVEQVYSSYADGAQSAVQGAEAAPERAWPEPVDGDEASLDLVAAQATHLPDLGTVLFELDTASSVATWVPEARGAVDGAPVLGYVLPTTLAPATVGFVGLEGLLALAVTVHPDFDDTPNFDEDLDGDYANDGAIYHVHWVVLVDDEASPAKLSVPRVVDPSQRPPSSPMPMAIDSPGYHAFASGTKLRVLVPERDLKGRLDFGFDALSAWMRVDGQGEGPVLRVESVLEILSGDLSLPLRISSR